MTLMAIDLDFIHHPLDDTDRTYILFIPEEVQLRYPILQGRYNVYVKLNPMILCNLIQYGWCFN